MAVSPIVISAYQRRFTRAQLEAALDQALNDLASGVRLTQVNFQDGGGSGQVIEGDPTELVEILELALRAVESGVAASQGGLAAGVNFSCRRVET